jgi:hypothetical protein
VKEFDLQGFETNCDKVQEWLVQDGCTIEDKAPGDGLAWFFFAHYNELHFGISQRVNHTDEIYIRMSAEFENSLAGLSLEEQKHFQKQVRFHLIHLGVEFDFDGLERVVISIRIFDDALTKDNFLSRIFKVQRAAIVTSWLLIEALEQVKELEPLQFIRPVRNSSLN